MIDFNDIPDWWPLCQKHNCQKAAQCLRFQACQQAPKGLNRWTCLLPAAVSGDNCDYFELAEPERMARGFVALYKRLGSRDARHDFRMALTDYFHSAGGYDRAKKGLRLLTAADQQWIRQWLADYGYTAEVEFDEYVDKYNFTHLD